MLLGINTAILVVITFFEITKLKLIKKVEKHSNFLLFLIPFFIITEAALIVDEVSPNKHSEITADGMLEYIVGALSFISTLILSVLALWQTNQIQKESDKSQKQMEKMTQDANDISRRMEELNEQANALALRANELNIISRIIDSQINKYNKLKQLLYHYSKLTNSNSIKLLLLDIGQTFTGTLEYRKTKETEFNTYKNELQHLASEISLLIMQDGRNEIESKELHSYLKALNEVIFDGKLHIDTDKYYLERIDECRAKYDCMTVKYLSGFQKDIDLALYNPMTLAEVRNLFNPPQEENTENGQTENGNP